MQGSSRTSRLCSRGVELVQVSEEVIGRLVHSHLASGNELVDLTLTPLPVLGPEPRLIGRHRQRRTKLDHTVSALENLDLRAGFIQVHSPAELTRQGDQPAGLQPDVAMETSHAIIVPYSCNTAIPQYRNTVLARLVDIHPIAASVTGRKSLQTAYSVSSSTRVWLTLASTRVPCSVCSLVTISASRCSLLTRSPRS